MFGALTFKEIISPKTLYERKKREEEKAKRKQRFVDNLKGPQIVVKVVPTIVEGAQFTVVNEGTGGIIQIMKVNGSWTVWGDIAFPMTFTNAGLELLLSEWFWEARSKDLNLRINDEWGCLEWDLKSRNG